MANYHKVAPNIDGVEVVSGEGKGMIRRCSHGEDHWTETCSLWVPEQVYSFEVDTHAHNYPYPFKSLRGQWEVESSGQSASKITMLFEFQYKRKFQNWLLHHFLRAKFSKIAEDLLDNWQNILEKKAVNSL